MQDGTNEEADVLVHHDQDSVFTSYAWTAQLLTDDDVRISYALRGARDNPEIESFHGRFKGENHSLFLDAEDLSELQAVVAGPQKLGLPGENSADAWGTVGI